MILKLGIIIQIKPKEIIEKINATVKSWKTYAKEIGIDPKQAKAINDIINKEKDLKKGTFIPMPDHDDLKKRKGKQL